MIIDRELAFTPEHIAYHRDRLKELLQRLSVLYGDFTLASGQKSSYYMDTRLTTLSAVGNALVSYNVLAKIRQLSPVVAIAGPVLGACPIVTGVSQLSAWTTTPLESIYIRKESKDHGTTKLIEGSMSHGDKIVMLEDVITTGSSVKKAINCIRQAGGIIDDLVCLILRETSGKESLERELDIRVHHIFTKEELLK